MTLPSQCRSKWTEASLREALARLPDTWFYGSAPFRQAAIAVMGAQRYADDLRKQLLAKGWLEGVPADRRAWRYRKLKELA